jgi:hypothetical protein
VGVDGGFDEPDELAPIRTDDVPVELLAAECTLEVVALHLALPVHRTIRSREK